MHDEEGRGHDGRDEEKQLHEGEMLEKNPAFEADFEEDELSTEDLAESNNIILSAVVDLLIKKNLITQDELDSVVAEIQSEDEDDDDEEESEPSM